jgi:mRNA interferase MazF
MGISAVREIVIVPFPYSDFSQTKVRPAVCIGAAQRGDWILCAVTSTGQGDTTAFSIDAADFESGGLKHHSFVRPSKPFHGARRNIYPQRRKNH